MKRILLSLVLVVLSAASCRQPVPLRPVINHTGAVTVIAVDWYHKQAMLENGYGLVFSTGWLCDPPLQLYIGERASDISYYWVTGDMPESGYDCNRILSVQLVK